MNDKTIMAGKTVPAQTMRAKSLRADLHGHPTLLDAAATCSDSIDVARSSRMRDARHVVPIDSFNVLHVGELRRENGLDILVESFLTASARNNRLHLVFVGTGPAEAHLRARLGTSATFVGRIEDDELMRVYARADLFVSASTSLNAWKAIRDAQASGLAVLAVDPGGYPELIEDGRSGCIVPPEPEVIAVALGRLARREPLRVRLAQGGLVAERSRGWKSGSNHLARG